MKLDDYAIRQYLAESNWKAAVEVLANHFGLQMPADYVVTPVKQFIYDPSAIAVYIGPRLCRWHSVRGFAEREITSRIGLSDIYALVYLSN